MVIRLLLLLALAAPAYAAEVAGVKIDDKARVADTELSLSGAGLRKRVFFQVYAIGLYVRDRKADPISQPGPKRVQIHMLRDVDAETFNEALADGIKANKFNPWAKRCRQLLDLAAAGQEIPRGPSAG